MTADVSNSFMCGSCFSVDKVGGAAARRELRFEPC